MTLWVRKFGLFTLLAFLIFACEDPGEIGLDLNPENGVFVAKYQEISLENSVILHQDVLADNATRIDSIQNVVSAGRILTGGFENQSFGKVSSRGYSGLYLGSVGFEDDNYTYDSLTFNVKVDYIYGSDLTGLKRLAIHELADSLKLDTLYLTRNTSPYLEDPVGEFVYDFSLLDTVWIDTVLTTKLSDELGMRFLQQAKDDASTFLNNREFRKFFSGFAFVSDESNNMITGIVAESRQTYLRMHVHNAEDTASLDFIFQDLDTIDLNSTKYYNNITLDRSGTPLAGITEFYTDFETDNNLTYVQASAGIYTKISLQPYLDFIDTIEHLVINRAEIEIPVQSFEKSSPPSTAFDMYVVDEDNRFVESFVPNRPHPIFVSAGRLSFSRSSDANEGNYVGTPTQYIQDITSGDSQDIFLMLGQPNMWNSVITVDQSILLKDKIILKVYYSALQ